MSAKRDDANGFAFLSVPLAMEPRASHNEICVIGIIFSGVMENLPRSPGIFLVPEAGDVQVRHCRGVQLVDPRFFFPERIVVWVLDGVIPVRNRAVQIF